MAILYLHIGMPKAGSSSIQAALAGGRQHLAGHGVDYFRLGNNHSSLFKALFRGEEAKKVPKFFRKMPDYRFRRTGIDRAAMALVFDQVLAASTMPKLVMSAEMLFGYKRKQVLIIKEYLSRFFDEIHIIVYVRDPISWASSHAQQVMKKSSRTLDEICDLEAIAAGHSSIVPYYRARLEPYVNAFGRDAVDIRLFDRSHLTGGDLIADFCAAIGEPSLASSLNRAVRNPSLSYEAVLLVNEYKGLLAARNDRARPSKVAAFHKRMKGLEGTRFALPRETLAYVWAAAAHDVAWLRQIMNAEVFEETYPPEAVTGPAWDTTTLWQLAELIDQALSIQLGSPRFGRLGK